MEWCRWTKRALADGECRLYQCRNREVLVKQSQSRQIYLGKYVNARVNEILPDEENISPGIRQTILHWGFEVSTTVISPLCFVFFDLLADRDLLFSST